MIGWSAEGGVVHEWCETDVEPLEYVIGTRVPVLLEEGTDEGKEGQARESGGGVKLRGQMFGI